MIKTIPVWDVSPTKPQTNQSRHASGNFLVPTREDDLRAADKSKYFSFTTHAVEVTKVEYASYDNLMKLKLELEEGRLKGHYNLVRDSYIGEAARMTINDAVSRIHATQAQQAFQKGEPFPQYQDYEWLDWSNGKFFDTIPPLLRLEHAIAKVPMTDCLTQLRDLKYVYDNMVSQGESQLQLDTYKVFKNTRVWISTMNENTEAVLMTHKKDGPRWLRNIIIELNLVVQAGPVTRRG